ncbi:LysE/ArgO family amino acid transporter [Hydrocarboniclastica marina]|uniref:Amino acid transporter n=1 Tax=Hydrocarboniclastica marina TaxID=2259620 RepID=A0A4P7XM42_9ALTE|nr:LysE/ArgO family amino acid transporter [Hydrocarboniclastica marina]MAM00193.1 amino acid transporter [Alteromonadaceae bacterium]QCF27532.1 amino acid transporter [Hydrocarboniclastica marina]|tara:strand:+ start:1766 stop:2389 length:624 start_codon:yes stop_codon:yes gene_type:complete
MGALLSGFFLGLSLIVAIGAQNAFVLKQGIRKEHVFWVCLVCALSDAILISFGVLGFSFVLQKISWLQPVMLFAGVLFLVGYGARSLWAGLTHDNESLAPSAHEPAPLKQTLAVCLAITWLNPHVYLDTVVLMGTVSAQFAGEHLKFLTGAVSASFLFFFSLGYGSTFLGALFRKPLAWKVLDIAIGLVMWAIAYRLVSEFVGFDVF